MLEKEYERLTRARRRQVAFVAFSYIRTSLWLGKDHLLCIDSNGYSETYKRFYFQDIQAVSIRLTQRRQVWNWVLGVLMIPCLLLWGHDLFFVRHLSLADIITGVMITVPVGLPLLMNNLLGPTCACQLRTAVQTEDLPPLCRLRKTRKILDRLRPLIAQAQGQLTPEEIPVRVQVWATAAAAANAAPAPEVSYVVDDPNAPPRITS